MPIVAGASAGPVVVGVGELLYDHVFLDHGSGLEYLLSSGGGSVTNVLANAAGLGVAARAVGVAGADALGQLARQDLDDLGVDVSSVRLLEGKATGAVFEILTGGGPCRGPAHRFTTACLVCGSPPAGKPARLELCPAHHSRLDDAAALCMDKLTRRRVEIAQGALRGGTLTVLDLGRTGHLRHLPPDEIGPALGSFQVIQTPRAVARWLVGRLGLTEPAQLCQWGTRLLVVTDGVLGLTLCDSRDPGQIRTTALPAPTVSELADDSGAGDALLGGLLVGLLGVPQDELWQLDHVALAALCRKALAVVPSALRAYGARGHLAGVRPPRRAVELDWAGISPAAIRQRLGQASTCPFCGCSPAQEQ